MHILRLFGLSILSALFGALNPAQGKEQTIDKTYIQVRLIDTNRSDSSSVMELIDSGKQFALKPEVLLGLSDIKRVTITQTSNPSPYTTLLLHCNPEGSEKFRTISRTYLKKRIGIIIDEKLVGVPIIVSEIRNGIIPIPIKRPQESVDQMAEEINRLISKLSKQ